jgi:hypothetical protein
MPAAASLELETWWSVAVRGEVSMSAAGGAMIVQRI